MSQQQGSPTAPKPRNCHHISARSLNSLAKFSCQMRSLLLTLCCLAMLLRCLPKGLAASRNTTRAMSSSVNAAQATNVLGGPLKCCCKQPYMTGYYRDGFCRTGGGDFGAHVVCAQVNEEFLEYTRSRGNDLSTPIPGMFPGLKPGDKWCLCASRWKEAHDAGKAPPVLLSACHVRALDYVDLAVLKQYAVPEEEPQEDGQQGAQDEL